MFSRLRIIILAVSIVDMATKCVNCMHTKFHKRKELVIIFQIF